MDPAARAGPVARPAKTRFFATPAAFGKWLETNHGTARELLVGYWKVATKKASMTWPESVEQALRYGWIDGVRRSLGEDAYCIRFTPRRPGSNWSAVNVRTAKRLIAEGRMAPAGLAAFQQAGGTTVAAYGDEASPRLSATALQRLKADAKAWAWFQAAAPSYRRSCAWWVESAKRPPTRERRLAQLIDCCARGEVVPPFKWSPKQVHADKPSTPKS